MKNYLFLGALVLALALIAYLYIQLTATQRELQLAEKRFTDCEQVTFQLQMQSSAVRRSQQGGRRDTLQ